VEFIAREKNARQSSLVDTGTATYIIPLQNKLTYGDHRSISFEVAVEDKSLWHHHQVCTMNVLEITFSAWAYIEVTCCVPFLKSYEPVTEVEKLIFTFPSRGCNFLKRVHNM